jgi:hypothetical protein
VKRISGRISSSDTQGGMKVLPPTVVPIILPATDEEKFMQVTFSPKIGIVLSTFLRSLHLALLQQPYCCIRI